MIRSVRASSARSLIGRVADYLAEVVDGIGYAAGLVRERAKIRDRAIVKVELGS